MAETTTCPRCGGAGSRTVTTKPPKHSPERAKRSLVRCTLCSGSGRVAWGTPEAGTAPEVRKGDQP